MARLGILAGGIDTVVAGIATFTDDFRPVMVDESIAEIGRVMTHGAVTAGILMYRCIRGRAGADHANIGEITVMA